MKGAADCRIDSRRGQRSRSDSRQKSATISGNLGKLRGGGLIPPGISKFSGRWVESLLDGSTKRFRISDTKRFRIHETVSCFFSRIN